MSYRVRYMPRVVAAIDRQVEYLLKHYTSVERVTAWLADLYDLTHWPHRHPIAEKASAEVGTEIRRVVFGNYLIFYRVDEARQGVDVIHFRHAAQETNRLVDDAT